MPNVDWDNVDDATDFSPVPEGEYRVQIVEIKEHETKSGNEMWRVKFSILDGDFKGRFIWDNMVWTEKAYPRLKFILKRLGFDPIPKNVTPQTIMNKQCVIIVNVEEYFDDLGGVKKRNVVPFAGYKSIFEPDNDEDIPF